MNLTKIFWSSKELERGQNKHVGRYQSKYLMLPKIFGIKKHFMFTKNIWHNCAERYAGRLPAPPCAACEERGWTFFVRFNESILQRGARHGTLMQCKKRNGLHCGHELYTGGLNHDPWPLIVSQTACTVSPVYRIVRRESCSAGAQAGADCTHVLYSCTVSPGQDRAGPALFSRSVQVPLKGVISVKSES